LDSGFRIVRVDSCYFVVSDSGVNGRNHELTRNNTKKYRLSLEGQPRVNIRREVSRKAAKDAENAENAEK
jgi:hypothetical protein